MDLAAGLAESAGDLTFFAVVDFVDLGVQYLFDTAVGRLTLQINHASNVFVDGGGAKGTVGVDIGDQGLTTGAVIIWRLKAEAGGGQVYVGGSLVEAGLTYTATAIDGAAQLFSHTNTTSNDMDGNCGQFGIYSRALSDVDVNRLGNYLSAWTKRTLPWAGI